MVRSLDFILRLDVFRGTRLAGSQVVRVSVSTAYTLPETPLNLTLLLGLGHTVQSLSSGEFPFWGHMMSFSSSGFGYSKTVHHTSSKINIFDIGKSQGPIPMFSRGLPYPCVCFQILRRGLYFISPLKPIVKSRKLMKVQSLNSRPRPWTACLCTYSLSLSPSLSSQYLCFLCFSGRRPFFTSLIVFLV